MRSSQIGSAVARDQLIDDLLSRDEFTRYYAKVLEVMFNDPQFLNWLKSSPGNLVERLMGIEDPDKFAEQLYLSILCRRPEDQERAMVVQMLASHAQERQSIVQELVWGLVASAEFRFML